MTLILNTTFAAQPKLSPFKKALAEMKMGTFKGKTDDKKDCTATLAVKMDKEGNAVLVAKIDFIGYDLKVSNATIEINSKKDDISFEKEEEADDYLNLAITKTKSVPEPDNEGASLTLVETINQDFEGKSLTGMRFEWYEINEHSDPHEDQLNCSIYNK